MDNIISRLSRQPGQPEQYKKFNPNPQPEYPVQNIQQFPQYEEWKSMIEGGTLPPEFDMRPSEVAPTGLPTEIPGEMPTGELSRFQPLMDYLGLTDPKELAGVIGEATDKDLAFLMEIAGVKEVEEKPVNYFDFTQKQAEDAYASGEWDKDRWDTWIKIQKDRGSLEKILGEEPVKPTSIDIMTAGQEQGLTTQDQYLNALMGELGMDYEKALSFYLTYTGTHPGYPTE